MTPEIDVRRSREVNGVQTVSASAVVSALSYALDLTEGQPMGHAMQTCMIGMRLAAELKLSAEQRGHLFYALLLKDAGCSSNASKLFHLLHSDDIRAKGDLKDKDWTRMSLDRVRYTLDHIATGRPLLERLRHLAHLAVKEETTSCDLVKLRCERGASIARQIGFPLEVALAIANLDEHWDGSGYPMGTKGEAIPLLAQVMNLSQTLAVFWMKGGPRAAVEMMTRRAGRWFDPELVRAAKRMGKAGLLWKGLGDADLQGKVEAMEPGVKLGFNHERMDHLCLAFAEVIDSKSPFTYRHSQGVAAAAVAIGERMGLPESEVVDLRRSALLHDIGKLSVPNTILEKPGKLDADEWLVVKKHPFYTLEILRRVPGFETMSVVAAAHHERLDGKGYFRGWGAAELNLHARILAAADVYDALAAERPYREALPLETVFSIMDKDVPHALDSGCVEALKQATVPMPATPKGRYWKQPGIAPDLVPAHAF